MMQSDFGFFPNFYYQNFQTHKKKSKACDCDFFFFKPLWLLCWLKGLGAKGRETFAIIQMRDTGGSFPDWVWRWRW